MNATFGHQTGPSPSGRTCSMTRRCGGFGGGVGGRKSRINPPTVVSSTTLPMTSWLIGRLSRRLPCDLISLISMSQVRAPAPTHSAEIVHSDRSLVHRAPNMAPIVIHFPGGQIRVSMPSGAMVRSISSSVIGLCPSRKSAGWKST